MYNKINSKSLRSKITKSSFNVGRPIENSVPTQIYYLMSNNCYYKLFNNIQFNHRAM